MPPHIAAMIVVIVAIVAASRLARVRYEAHGRIRSDPAAGDGDRLRAEQEIRQLKERVAVLERVITDNHGSADLDRQIERLRDR